MCQQQLTNYFRRLYSYLLREIFPTENSDFSAEERETEQGGGRYRWKGNSVAFGVMIRDLRDVGLDPLSPALRDIGRERGGPELH